MISPRSRLQGNLNDGRHESSVEICVSVLPRSGPRFISPNPEPHGHSKYQSSLMLNANEMNGNN